jgi:hypothetical protein
LAAVFATPRAAMGTGDQLSFSVRRAAKSTIQVIRFISCLDRQSRES